MILLVIFLLTVDLGLDAALAGKMQTSSRLFDQYTKPVLVGNGVAFTILPIIVVSLRFYARRVARVVVGIDDWCIVVALVNIRILRCILLLHD